MPAPSPVFVLAAAGAAVLEVQQNLNGLADDVVRFAVLQIDDEADAAGIVFVLGVVQPLPERMRMLHVTDSFWQREQTRRLAVGTVAIGEKGGGIAAFLQQFDKAMSGVAQSRLAAMNDADGPHETTAFQGPSDQRTGPHFLAKRRLRQHARRRGRPRWPA